MAIIAKVSFDANPMVSQKTGIGQLSYELFSALARNNPNIHFVGHYFDFLGKKNSRDLPSYPNLTYKKTILFPSKILNALRRIGIQLPFEIFCRSKADLLVFPNFVSTPSLFKTPSVLFVHDLSYVDVPSFISEKNGNYLRKWVGSSLRAAHYIITISEFTKKRIVEYYNIDSSKITVIPVPPKPLVEPNNEHVDIIDNCILFVGTIEPRKNLLNLLGSYKLLEKRIQKLHPLVLAGGKGWKDDEILSTINRLRGQGVPIIKTGYVSDQQKSALYHRASIVIQPSHYEGFGMPVLEAMSYGKPVLCSDIEVFHEIAGDAAVYFDKDDPAAINDAISEILRNPEKQKEMSVKSTKHVKNYPSWDDVATQLSEILF